LNEKEKDLKNVIGTIFSTNKKLSRGYNEYNIDSIWRSTFGEMISQYTSQVRFHKGELTVYITSAALKQELSLNKQTIIDKLNKILKYKKINSLRIC